MANTLKEVQIEKKREGGLQGLGGGGVVKSQSEKKIVLTGVVEVEGES